MITIAIPTLARREYALDALRSIAHQVCDTPFEVLVLDNDCDPLLRADVQELAARVDVPVTYVPVPTIGLHNARHESVRRARGDILVYVDDDVIADQGWLDAIADGFADPTVHMVGGRLLPRYEENPPPWVEAFWTRNGDGSSWCGSLTLMDLGPDSKGIDPMLIWGANFAIRKETLTRVGGFHPDALPWHLRRYRGDGETAVSEAVRVLGLRAVYSPNATVHHRVPRERLTEGYFERRAFLQGISDSYAASRAAGGALMPQLNPGFARRLRGRIGMVLRSSRTLRRGSPAAVPQFQRAAEAHAAGYAYHQEVLAQDSTVRRWVMKEDYWLAAVPGTDPSGTEHDKGASGIVTDP